MAWIAEKVNTNSGFLVSGMAQAVGKKGPDAVR
jgi:hypothetical protein